MLYILVSVIFGQHRGLTSPDGGSNRIGINNVSERPDHGDLGFPEVNTERNSDGLGTTEKIWYLVCRAYIRLIVLVHE